MLQFIIYILLIAISAVAAWWLYFTSTRFYKLCIKIPGPTPKPVIGNAEIFINEKPIHKLFEISKNYYPICKILIGSVCLVVLQDADDVYKLLHSSKTLSKTIVYKAVKMVLGDTILSATREKWRKHRRIMNPAFNTQVVRNYIGIFNDKCEILIRLLKSKEGIIELDMYTIMLMTTLDMIYESATGINFKILENNRTDIVHSIEKIKDIIQRCIISPKYWLEFVYKYSKIYKEASDVLKWDEEIIKLVHDKYKISNKSEKNNVSSEKLDCDTKSNLKMLDFMFKSMHNKNDYLTDEELVNERRLLGLAGSETTAFTISVCIKLLGLHKDIQDKVVRELNDIFSDDINRPTNYDDLQRMTYTEQVIKESLRLYPVTFATARRVDEDIEIGGFLIPAKTDIVISPYLLHRNSKYFTEPFKFDPERFSPENISKLHPHCFIPFLSGPRNCIGHYYAMLQIKTVLSHILCHFEILPCGSREEMEDIDMSMLLSLKNGYNVRMKLRL